MSFVIGPGMLQKIQERGWHPASDEVFFSVSGTSKLSVCSCDEGLLWYCSANNRTATTSYDRSSLVKPTVTWVGSPNFWASSLSGVRYLFVHTEVGTEQGTDQEFGNAANQVSAHYSVGLDGSVHQYVALTDAAWANGGPNPGWRWPFGSDNPNLHSVSIETEDDGNPSTQPVTDAQFGAIVALYKTVIQPTWPEIQYLCAHNVVNPAHSCPAERWLNTGKFDELGATLGLQVIK